MSSIVLVLLVSCTANARDCERSPQSPTPMATEQQAVATTNGLAVDLFHALADEHPGENLFFSPYSVAIALAMTAEGARQETAVEMANALHVPVGEDPATPSFLAVHRGFAEFAERFRKGAGDTSAETARRIEELRAELAAAIGKYEELQRAGERKARDEARARARELMEQRDALLSTVDRYDLRVANALWVEQTFPLVPAFVEVIDRYYGTGCAIALDFIRNPEPSRLHINGWGAEHTEQRILDLIQSGGVTSDTRIVVTNAVYFRGAWTVPFSEHSTWDEDFTLANGELIRAKLMHDGKRTALRYAAFSADGSWFRTPMEVPWEKTERPPTYPDDDGFTMLELPYKGGDLAMLVLLPRTADGLPRLEKQLSARALRTWVEHLESRVVWTQLLRFEQRATYSLRSALERSGMQRAFQSPLEPRGAQFTGISASADPADGLFISQVAHQGWIQVDETGTEAAAATMAVGPTTGMEMTPTIPFVPEFHTDHPFLFLIRDRKSGAILFLGRMVDPRTP